MSKTTLRRGVREVTAKPGHGSSFPAIGPSPAQRGAAAAFGTGTFRAAMAGAAAAGPAMTAQQFNARQTQRRNQEYATNSLLGYHQEKARIHAIVESDKRVDTMRRIKRLQDNNAELQFHAGLEASANAEAQRQALSEQDTKLMQTLAEMKSNQIAKQTDEKRICDESEDLQKLKLQLAAAHLNKARHLQMEEKTYIKAQQKELDGLLEQRMAEDRARAEAELYEQKQKELFDNMERRKMLRAQVDHKQKERAQAYAAFLAEKAAVDAVVAGLAEEDNQKRNNALKRKYELQANIQQYLEERRLWREGERKRAEAELRKIQEYNALQQKRYEELLQKKQQNVDLQAKMLARVTAEIEAKKREEDEMRLLLDELYQEEAESKALAAIQSEQARRDRIRHDMLAANDLQKQIKQQRAQEQAKDEAEFRQRMLAKFEEDKRLETMNAVRRKREIAAYRAEVEKLVEERRAQYEAVRVAEQQAAEQKAIEDAQRRAVVERERQRLLAEHAKNLADFLPKNVIQNAQEFRLVHGEQKPLPSHLAAAAAGKPVKNHGKRYNVYTIA